MPLTLRHAHVHEDDVGRQLLGLGDRVLAVVGLADDVDAVLGLEDEHQPAPEQRVVVDDQDADALAVGVTLLLLDQADATGLAAVEHVGPLGARRW